jgi:hypothetical protein
MVVMKTRGHDTAGGPRVLLSSPTRPFGQRFGDSFSCQTNGPHQMVWAQDLFRIEDPMRHWGLDLIASNIKAPATVLHYPTLSQFIREIKKGYDYIGLSFNLPTFHKIKRMVSAAREHAPRSRIILGGYGTILPDEAIAGFGDHICREEGISYMRRLLGEDDAPFRDPDITLERYIFSVKVGTIGAVFSSVGCPNGCDFCCTSHYFKKKKIYFHKNARELYEAVLACRRTNRGMASMVVMDEDFLIDRERAAEFHSLARRSDEFLDIMVFASVKSLSRFTAPEIAEMGISKVWIGFEGKRAGYGKQEGGDFKRIVEELRDYGISVTASMMIGFDYQTERTVREEFGELVSCRPIATQIFMITPCAGTPLWDRLNRDNRLIEALKRDYRLHDGFTQLFDHPHMRPADIESLQKDLYREEYGRLGPSPFRVMYTQYLGYKKLRSTLDPLLKRRADHYRASLRKTAVLYELGIMFAPNRAVRDELARQYKEIKGDIGSPGMAVKMAARILVPFALWTRFRFRHDLFMQPEFARKCYNGAAL